LKLIDEILKLPLSVRLLFSLLILIISAQLKLDIGLIVPFTLQTFVICLIIYWFNFWPSILIISSYIVLATIGVPVLSGWNTLNENNLFSSGGFLLGFLLTTALMGLLKSSFNFKKFFSILLFAFFIHLVILLIGTFAFYSFDNGLNTVFKTFVYLIPGVLFKSFLFSFLIYSFRKT